MVRRKTSETDDSSYSDSCCDSEDALEHDDDDEQLIVEVDKDTTDNQDHDKQDHDNQDHDLSRGENESPKPTGDVNVSWHTMYGHLVQFWKENGHCSVPKKYRGRPICDGQPLATTDESEFDQGKGFLNEALCRPGRLHVWVDEQRRKKKQGKLTDHQIQALESVDGWKWEWFQMESWDSMYKKLKHFYEEHGHCRTTGEDGKLHGWVVQQRRTKSSNAMTGSKRHLSPEQIRKLDGIEFQWKAKNASELWEEHFLELKEYAEKNGHCRVPFLSEGTLGRWVRRQRQFKTKKTGKNSQLTPEQIAKLDSIGFAWKANENIETWEAMYEKLRQFKAEHGHVLVTRKEGKLGDWVNAQRMRRHRPYQGRKQLTNEQVKLLDELRFAWTKEDRMRQLWDKMYEELKDYVETEGHCLVPQKFVSPKHKQRGSARLGKWVEDQRGRRNGQAKKLPLKEDQIQRLDELGFVWKLRHKRVAVHADDIPRGKLRKIMTLNL